jgi:hypothetical protein
MFRRVLFICLIALLFCGCLPSGPVSQTSGVHGAANYTVKVTANTSCPGAGENVIVRAKVSNDGDRPEVAVAMNEPVFDLIVTGRERTIRWSDGKPLTPELTRLELKPGEFKSVQLEFKSEGGSYNAIGRLVYDAQHPNGVVETRLFLNQWCGGY